MEEANTGWEEGKKIATVLDENKLAFFVLSLYA